MNQTHKTYGTYEYKLPIGYVTNRIPSVCNDGVGLYCYTWEVDFSKENGYKGYILTKISIRDDSIR